jgi:malonyl-CoA decarboxylase
MAGGEGGLPRHADSPHGLTGTATRPHIIAMNTSFFGELLQSIAERGRSLIERTRERRPAGEVRAATFVELCEALLSGRGEASGVALAREILTAYSKLRTGERIAFFEALAESFGPDRVRLARACAAYGSEPTDEAANEVLEAAEPRRQELIRRINLAPGATGELVQMREHLLDALARRSDLAPVDRDFVHLLGSWFNRGFLVLKRIDWSMPAIVLEKLIRYEAVHEIHSWDDLRARIDPPDRRCYAFFHPALVDEPLIFVEVALTRAIPDAIAPILQRERTPLDPKEATTATFYSISNCQRGLGGVTFGNFLIKQVVEEISHEFPKLSTFVTLSPVNGFRDWLNRERRSETPTALLPSDAHALSHLDDPDWFKHPEKVPEAKPVLSALAAHFYLIARTRGGRPIDPVARFHLGNGARLERINPMADMSGKAIERAYGLMVNYRYVPDDIEKNHEAFAGAGEVVASSQVKKLLRTDAKQTALVPAP